MFFNHLNEFKDYIELSDVKSEEALMIFVGENSACELENMMEHLNNKNIKFFGGIYPRLLFKDKCLQEGFLVEKLEYMHLSIVLPYLMRFKMDKSDIDNCTAIVLIDGLSSRMQELVDTIQNKLGNGVKYIGGGAGFYDLKHRPCIFDNNGIHQDAAYVCIVKNSTKIAVKHGWNKLDGPYLVTESKGNTLSKLDGYSAFQVYRDVMEDTERITLYKEDFFIYAKDHPFGILKDGGKEFIVRDPITINDKEEIVCVANIPEDSNIYVLKGDKESLLNSSLQIAEYCSENASENYKPMIFDCISRAMFLEEDFEEELRNIQNKLLYKLIGALSIGEISSSSNGEPIIHNKSTILGLMEL